MELSQNEVLMILKIVQEADVGYLELQVGDLHLVLSKDAPNGVPAAMAPAPAAAGEAPSASAAPSTAAQAPADPAPAPKPEPQAPPPAAAPEDGLVAVHAPMVGVFYSRPDPTAAPFVQAGDTVDEETTVGLIEVMKVFNAVRAGAAGRVERILVEDGQFVEFGQDLILVRPVG